MIYAIFNHTKQMRLLIVFSQNARRIPCVGNFFAAMLEYVVRIYFSSEISSKAVIPSDVVFVHGSDIVIGAGVFVGRRCKIFNGVTLGNRDTETTVVNQPVIGDDCVISTGAKILGNINIGNRSIVGANAVVICDVPPDSIAVGVPAKVLPRNKSERLTRLH